MILIGLRNLPRLRVFPRLPPPTHFPALTTIYFSRAYHFFRAYRQLRTFPALITGYVLFLRLPPITCFTTLSLVTCFTALVTGYVLSRACHWLKVFPRLPQAFASSSAWWVISLVATTVLMKVTIKPAQRLVFLLTRALLTGLRGLVLFVAFVLCWYCLDKWRRTSLLNFLERDLLSFWDEPTAAG